uniref:Nucleoprotein n=1 Tax=Moussa virus TaxID=698672 RepID=D2E9X8_9RHAB|nr:nucleoprotein [Moussa virus]
MRTNLPGHENTVLEATLPETSVTVVYPSVWFKNVGNVRPGVSHSLLTPSELYQTLHPMLTGGKWNDVLVSSYMVSIINENPGIFEETLSANWVAQGRTIGEEGTKVNPLHCLSLDTKDIQLDHTPRTSDGSTRMSLFVALVMIYRRTLIKSTKTARTSELNAKMLDMMGSAPYGLRQEHMTLVSQFLEDKNLTEGYTRIICALDMFYTKFPQGQGSKLRISTLVSRYRGCSAIVSVTHACNCLGITADELVTFILHNHVAAEAIRTFKAGEHSADKYGYFPYQLGMRLTEHSPYTISANPSLTFYVRCLAAFGGSSNAGLTIMPSGVNAIQSLIEVAFMVTLKTGKLMNLAVRFGKTDAEMKALADHVTAKDKLRDNTEEEIPDGEEEGIVQQGWAASVKDLPTRAGLTEPQKLADDIISEIEQNEGLDYLSRTRLHNASKRFKGYDEGTVGRVIYENYGRSAPNMI